MEQKWLFGAIDSDTKEFLLKNIDNRSRRTLNSIIEEAIEEGTTVHSDMWSSYMAIFNNNPKYNHEYVNHSEIFVNPDNGVHTNLAENLWMRMKQGFRRRFQRSHNHLDEYINEFCFREKYKNPFVMFSELVKNINLND